MNRGGYPLWLRGASLLLLALLYPGCSAYQLGGPDAGNPGFRRLFVPPIENEAILPQITAPLSRALREELSRDPRIILSDSAGGSAVLQVRVVSANSEKAAVQTTDSRLGASYVLEVIASGTLTLPGGKSRPVGPVSARLVNQAGGLPQSQRTNLPILARELAEKLTHAATVTW